MKKIKVEGNIIKDVRNLLRLEEEVDDTLIKEAIKDWVTREIRTLVDHEEEDYDKPVKVGNFWSNNYIE